MREQGSREGQGTTFEAETKEKEKNKKPETKIRGSNSKKGE